MTELLFDMSIRCHSHDLTGRKKHFFNASHTIHKGRFGFMVGPVSRGQLIIIGIIVFDLN